MVYVLSKQLINYVNPLYIYHTLYIRYIGPRVSGMLACESHYMTITIYILIIRNKMII